MVLNIKAFALAGGVLWGACIFLLGLVAMTGWGAGVVDALGSLYLGFEAGVLGACIGLLWAFVDGVIGCALFAWLYNRFGGKN